MKYIDAEKLTKAIEDKGLDCSFALKMERLDILALIDSLQQEQEDFPTSDKECEEFLATHSEVEVPDKYKTPDWLWKKQEQPSEICSKCIHHGKDDGYCYNPHGGMQSLINENGVYECTGFCEQEQSEVDLEEAAEKYSDKYCSDWAYRLEYEAFFAGAEWQYQKDRGEFAKLKAKEWINGYDEGYAKGLNARKKD